MEAGALTLGNLMGEIRNRILIAGPGLILLCSLRWLRPCAACIAIHMHSNEPGRTVPITKTCGGCPGDDPEPHESQVPVHELQVAVPDRAPFPATAIPELHGQLAGWAHLVAE